MEAVDKIGNFLARLNSLTPLCVTISDRLGPLLKTGRLQPGGNPYQHMVQYVEQLIETTQKLLQDPAEVIPKDLQDAEEVISSLEMALIDHELTGLRTLSEKILIANCYLISGLDPSAIRELAPTLMPEAQAKIINHLAGTVNLIIDLSEATPMDFRFQVIWGERVLNTVECACPTFQNNDLGLRIITFTRNTVGEFAILRIFDHLIACQTKAAKKAA